MFYNLLLKQTLTSLLKMPSKPHETIPLSELRWVKGGLGNPQAEQKNTA
jgi:hypothetical protein